MDFATSNGLSEDLKAAFEALQARRGSIPRWNAMEIAVTQRIGACSTQERVWCKGEVHTQTKHFPAFVVYNQMTGKLLILAPSGENDSFEEHPHHLFHPNIPHTAIAREVLDKERRTVVVAQTVPVSPLG